ncbi:GNAT family N-acetyltransferase [Solihabitans fulvus]|uniref:GNAT family N-acetyltransferase n=1 Tax=Solihabitans fulvus TaxID=1892852 RepID=A0A5B2XDV6_9PSEU|nr:GNAT family N-acetyltransferase [Solihabitans fulvus]KAA2261180.1 GNAT family N-acetyltransferase [Solihabitans fulvus]
MTGLRTTTFDALTSRELDSWHALRAANPALDSPYFHPGFAAAVHGTGRRVLVAVDEEFGEIRSLTAVHRDGAVARPVGWPAADFQAPIRAPGTVFAPLTLLSSVGAREFAFDHLVEDPDFEPWVDTRRPSPFLDVTGGLTGYLGRASRSGKDNMGQARRRAARAERELGPLRFEVDNRDPALLDSVIDLKRAQYRSTGARDYFGTAGRAELLHGLHGVRGSAFGGILSTLHAGPRLLAAHFGLRADGVLHWWFPVYEPEFGRLSPGWLLLRELVTAAPALGIARIDLGRGEDEYKRRAMTGHSTVSQGAVSSDAISRALRRARNSAVAAAKSSPLGPPLRALAHRVRAVRRG